MNLIVSRKPAIGQALPGEMTCDGHHVCWTLERVAVAIPEGTYRVTLYDSPHFGRPMPMLNGVADRSCILLHWGDYPQNSDGCVLVGEIVDPQTGDIYNTQKAFLSLFAAVEAAVGAEGCWVQVRKQQLFSDLAA